MRRNLPLIRRVEMWDLAVIIAMNEKAHQDYLKKEEKKKEKPEGGKVNAA